MTGQSSGNALLYIFCNMFRCIPKTWGCFHRVRHFILGNGQKAPGIPPEVFDYLQGCRGNTPTQYVRACPKLPKTQVSDALERHPRSPCRARTLVVLCSDMVLGLMEPRRRRWRQSNPPPPFLTTTFMFINRFCQKSIFVWRYIKRLKKRGALQKRKGAHRRARSRYCTRDAKV